MTWPFLRNCESREKKGKAERMKQLFSFASPVSVTLDVFMTEINKSVLYGLQVISKTFGGRGETDREFHGFRAAKSATRRILFSSEKLKCGFCGSLIGKWPVGQLI